MTLLAPWFFAAGIAGAAVVAALHFLARQLPPRDWFPTARFVPDHPARAPSRALRPTDLMVMALRMLALALAGLALAQPVTTPTRRDRARVVAVERSRAVADPRAALDSARALLQGGDVLVVFDSSGREVPADSLAARGPWRARGSLTAGLLAARRAALALSPRADSIELIVVAPLVRESWDAATAGIRALWPAGVRLVRVAAADPPRGRVVVTGTTGDDPVAAGVALRGAGAGAEAVRIRRDAEPPAEADLAFASAGGALVLWPAQSGGTDTIGAVVARGAASGAEAVVVAQFARRVRPESGDTIARWADGEPAATERVLGAGCVRDVRIDVPSASDVILGEPARRLLAVLAGPCGGVAARAPLADSLVALLAGGPEGAAALTAQRATAFPPVSRWLLVAAALLLVGEMAARRRAS